jgi:hypothetical protein
MAKNVSEGNIPEKAGLDNGHVIREKSHIDFWAFYLKAAGVSNKSCRGGVDTKLWIPLDF